MTKKKPKRAAKPKALKIGSTTIAFVRPTIRGAVRIIEINWPTLDADDARRLMAWLPGAIAWCEEGSVTR